MSAHTVAGHVKADLHLTISGQTVLIGRMSLPIVAEALIEGGPVCQLSVDLVAAQQTIEAILSGPADEAEVTR